MAEGLLDAVAESGKMNAVVPDCPAMEQAQEAFLKDLPELLKSKRGQWVAYQGPQRVALGQTQEAVYQFCLDQGFNEEDFLVVCIEPDAGASAILPHCQPL